MMPIMDGWGFLKACLQEHLCLHSAVLVMSAYHGLADEASKLGVSGCVAKPFDLDVLLGSVGRLANRQHQ